MNELSLLTKAIVRERKDIAIAIVCGFVAGIAGVGLFAASGYMISQTVFAPPLYTLIVLTSLVKILGLVRAAARYAERLYTHRATFSVLGRLRAAVFAKLVPLSSETMGRARSGDLLARVVGDVESLQHYFLRVLYPPILIVMVFLATVLFTSAFSLWVACMLVLGMFVTAFIVPAIVRLGQRGSYERVRLHRADFSTEAAEMLYGFRELKLYGKLIGRSDRLRQLSEGLTEEQQTAGRHLLRGQAMHLFVYYLVTWAVLVMGGWLMMEGRLAGVYLAMLLLAAMTVFEDAGAMAVLPAYKQESEHAAKRLAEIVRTADLQPQQPSAQLVGEQAAAVELRGVSFLYADEWRPALREVDLSIPAGTKTAIVGASGSGKTTILELLLKLHTPSAGQVRLNGIPVEELDAASIWRSSNVVMQRSHFFRGTVRDNLLLDEADSRSDEQLTSMLARVQLAGKTLDDPVYEKGENLSAGERQRLALARAMLKGGRFWLLDEPTSSLDAVTEQRLFHELFAQASGDTMLLISHRLTGLSQMDHIIVMDRGRVAESGTYSELMALQGAFYEMNRLEQQLLNETGSSGDGTLR